MSEGSLKEMAELLRKGAIMLSETCPKCGTPLFKLDGGTIICPMCQQTIKIVSSDIDEQDITQQQSLEDTLRNKITYIQNQLEDEVNPLKIRELINTLILLLDARNKVKNIK
jgi:UPF0148 protein